MKSYLQIFGNGALCSLLLTGLWTASQIPAFSATKTITVEKAAPAAKAEAAAEAEAEQQAAAERKVIVKSIELPDGESAARKDLPWLGVSATEAGEALTAQLGLDPGVGLVVSYVASNSPAAKAGLQKHDVLVEFQDQALVLPAQLRKLVQARKEGDAVKLKFYRAGKPQTVSATLAKTPRGFWMTDGEDFSPHDFHFRLLGPPFEKNWRPFEKDLELQMEALGKTLGNLKVDHNKIQEEVRRSVEQARKSYENALRQVGKSTAATASSRKALEELARSGVLLDNKAAVTVRSTDKSSKSMVKTDDSGTFVLVANPKVHLTAHDKDGKLLFDGEIYSDEQRAQVPREVWEKVEPMLSKFNSKPEE